MCRVPKNPTQPEAFCPTRTRKIFLNPTQPKPEKKSKTRTNPTSSLVKNLVNTGYILLIHKLCEQDFGLFLHPLPPCEPFY